MSNEMNLYKRCKNIFKSHGVDMGGSGSGGNDNVFVVIFTQDEDGGIQCNRTIDEITEAFEDKLVVGFLAIQDEDTAIHYQTMVLSSWIPGFAMAFELIVYNSDGISVTSVSYDDEAGAWAAHAFKYEIERSDEE